MKHTNGAVHSANGARLDQIPDLDAQREVAGPDGLHEEDILLLGLLNQLAGLRGRHGKRLLAENVLAGIKGEHGILEVVTVRGGDVDDVDVWIGHQLMVRSVGLGGAGGLDEGEEIGRLLDIA